MSSPRKHRTLLAILIAASIVVGCMLTSLISPLFSTDESPGPVERSVRALERIAAAKEMQNRLMGRER